MANSVSWSLFHSCHAQWNLLYATYSMYGAWLLIFVDRKVRCLLQKLSKHLYYAAWTHQKLDKAMQAGFQHAPKHALHVRVHVYRRWTRVVLQWFVWLMSVNLAVWLIVRGTASAVTSHAFVVCTASLAGKTNRNWAVGWKLVCEQCQYNVWMDLFFEVWFWLKCNVDSQQDTFWVMSQNFEVWNFIVLCNAWFSGWCVREVYPSLLIV